MNDETIPFTASSASIEHWSGVVHKNEHIVLIINIKPLFDTLAALIYFRYLIQSCSWIGIELHRGGGILLEWKQKKWL